MSVEPTQQYFQQQQPQSSLTTPAYDQQQQQFYNQQQQQQQQQAFYQQQQLYAQQQVYSQQQQQMMYPQQQQFGGGMSGYGQPDMMMNAPGAYPYHSNDPIAQHFHHHTYMQQQAQGYSAQSGAPTMMPVPGNGAYMPAAAAATGSLSHPWHQQQQPQQSQQPTLTPATSSSIGAPAAEPFSRAAAVPKPQLVHAPAAGSAAAAVAAAAAAAATAAPAAPAAAATAAVVVVDAAKLLLPPGRASRPKKLLVLLRGLPGSGKSTVARKLRELEVEQGGEPPRVLSLDDYFMAEVEKEVVEEDGNRKGKRRKVFETEYQFEAAMEAPYRKSLLRAATKTLEEGRYSFVIVDAPNARLEEYKEFWALGQKHHFEVYVLRPLESSVEVCHKRCGSHKRTLTDVFKMSQAWEAVPPLYTELDVSALFGVKAASIQEVEMGSDREGSSSGDDSSDDAPTRKPHPSSDPESDGDVRNAGPRKLSGGSRWGSSGDRGTAPASNHRRRSAGSGEAQGDAAVGGGGVRAGKAGSRKLPSSVSDEDILAGLSEFSGSVGSRPAGVDASLDALGERSSRVGVGESSGAGGRAQAAAAAAAGRRHQIRTSLSQVSVWDPTSPQTPSSLRVKGGERAGAGAGSTEAGSGVSGSRSGGARVQAGGFALRVRWPDQVPMLTSSHAADSPLAGSTTQCI
ncbi:MAG: hypothetical protein WDW36_001322 [Sanguina aurantia]